MIYIGNDIIEVNRIKQSIDSYGEKFINKIFNTEEIEYCNNRKEPYIHFAGRFAAKEAIKKAILSLDNKLLITLKSIVIHRLDSGEPKPTIQANINQFKLIIKVSISHTEQFATAVALVINK